MNIERHIFGSYRGYTTLAKSPGVTDVDCRALEGAAYGFGQSHDKQFGKTLAQLPAYFTCVLPGGRRGLTRVFEGTPDDNGRPTLRLITAILTEKDWNGQLLGDLGILLADARIWEWEFQRECPALNLQLGAPRLKAPVDSVPRLLALICETERAIVLGKPVIISAADYSAEDMIYLEMLVPPLARRQFTSACRSLSARLPVTVNCLAAEAGPGGVTFRYNPQAAAPSAYGTVLAASELATGALPLRLVGEYRSFTPMQTAVSTTPAVESAPSVEHQEAGNGPFIVAVVVGLILAVCTFFFGLYIGSLKVQDATAAAAQAKQAAADAGLKLSDLQNDVRDLEADRNKLMEAKAALELKLAKDAAATQAASATQTAKSVHELQLDNDRLKTEMQTVASTLESAKRHQAQRYLETLMVFADHLVREIKVGGAKAAINAKDDVAALCTMLDKAGDLEQRSADDAGRIEDYRLILGYWRGITPAMRPDQDEEHMLDKGEAVLINTKNFGGFGKTKEEREQNVHSVQKAQELLAGYLGRLQADPPTAFRENADVRDKQASYARRLEQCTDWLAQESKDRTSNQVSTVQPGDTAK